MEIADRYVILGAKHLLTKVVKYQRLYLNLLKVLKIKSLKEGSIVLPKIFISYSHQDSVCARGIARFLLRQNYDVWIDVEKLVTGQKWATSIDAALKKADVVIALISRNSVRRPEVLREVSEALDRAEQDEQFKVLFVVIGNVHASWFAGEDPAIAGKVIDYLKKVQFVQLDARGSITIPPMQNILRAINGKMLHTDGVRFQDTTEYIYEAGIPEKVYDNEAENAFYRVRSSDLAPSTAFPFALDNQWLPDDIVNGNPELTGEFLRYGFGAEKVQNYLEKYQLKNLYLALMHTRQIVLNRAAILNSRSLQKLYCRDGGYSENEKKAFASLLQNGSIVVFLYGDKEFTPYIAELPQYETMTHAIKEWNALCKKVSIYCIRENWEKQMDRHKQEFIRECTTLALNSEKNQMIAECFGFGEAKKEEFFAVLKEIEMTVFLQTHISGTGRRAKIDGYSRSNFYKNFIVGKKSSEDADPVLNCIFDSEKPFHQELKKIVDVYYNSMLASFFNCTALIPSDIRPEDTFIYQLYLDHGVKEVGPDELEYAFSEFFQEEAVLKSIKEIGDDFYIQNWDMERIVNYRNGIHWREYIERMEYVANRAIHWEVDFSEVKNLVELFVSSVRSCSEKGDNKKRSQEFVPAYTFRLCIGSKVLDVVCTENVRKLKSYPGLFFAKDQNNLSIQFLIGDSTSKKSNAFDSVFLPVKIFNGKTSSLGGDAYFDEIRNFLTDQCDFLTIY